MCVLYFILSISYHLSGNGLFIFLFVYFTFHIHFYLSLLFFVVASIFLFFLIDLMMYKIHNLHQLYYHVTNIMPTRPQSTQPSSNCKRSYVQAEMEALEREQEQIDQRASDVERQLRCIMDSGLFVILYGHIYLYNYISTYRDK